jgi:hypothetical protein
LSDWKVIVDDKSSLADVVYTAIYRNLVHRRLPVDTRARRLQIDNHSVRNYVELVDDKHTLLISVFAYGGDLFVSWSMWRRRLPARRATDGSPVIISGNHWAMTLTSSGQDYVLRSEQSEEFLVSVHTPMRIHTPT